MEERTLQLQPHQVQGPGATNTEKAPSSAAALVLSDDSDDDGGEFEFEFPSVSRDSPAGTAAPADELFADGRIRPFFYDPAAVFGRGGVSHYGGRSTGFAVQQPVAPQQRVRGKLGRLFLEESRSREYSSSSVSSESDDDGGGGLEGAPPESYCLWTPAAGSSSSSSSPRAPPGKRSSSTGSSVARWRRISELVVGRSHSDGKDRFMFFFPAPEPKKREAPGADNKRHTHNNKMTPPKQAAAKVNNKRPSSTASGGRKQAPSRAAEVDSAHRVAAYGATPRRTFLPYREELVGFFANVNGISRSHHLTF